MLVDDSNIFSDPAFRGSDLQPEPSEAEPAAAPASEKFQWVNRATLRMLEQLALDPSIEGDDGSDDGSDSGGLPLSRPRSTSSAGTAITPASGLRGRRVCRCSLLNSSS